MIKDIKRFFQEFFDETDILKAVIIGMIMVILVLLETIRTDDTAYTDATVRLYLSGHEEESEGYHVIVKNGNVIVINSEGKYVTTKENWR